MLVAGSITPMILTGSCVLPEVVQAKDPRSMANLWYALVVKKGVCPFSRNG